MYFIVKHETDRSPGGRRERERRKKKRTEKGERHREREREAGWTPRWSTCRK